MQLSCWSSRIRAGVALVALSLSMTVICQAKQFQVRGFITRIISPTSFQVDNYAVVRDDTAKLDTNRKSSDDNPIVVDPAEIRIGTDVEVKGDLNESSSELKARSIKIFLEPSKPFRRSAILSKTPDLQKTDKGWEGLIVASGQRISVTDATLISVLPSRLPAKDADSANKKKVPESKPVPLTSTDDLSSVTFLMYEGTRQKDGTILATKIVFHKPEVECGEAKMLKKLTPKIKEPDYAKSKSGELKVGWDKYKLIANKEAQDYVSTLGSRLIPASQRQLPDTSSLKIPFKFYLVEKASSMVQSHPNGVVIVNSAAFDVYKNEAQLAYLIAREIDHVIGKHEWRIDHYHRDSLAALALGGRLLGVGLASTLVADGIRSGYAQLFEDESDCAALQQMFAAGYDVREAPKAWKVFMAAYPDKDSAAIWSKDAIDTTRVGFLMSEIRNNYADADFSTLVNNSTDYQRVNGIVRKIMYDKRSRVTPLYR